MMTTSMAIEDPITEIDSIEGLIDTILSNPDEWAALIIGLVLGIVLIWKTDDLITATAGIIITIFGLFIFAPIEIFSEWHYWGFGVVILVTLLYEYGPEM